MLFYILSGCGLLLVLAGRGLAANAAAGQWSERLLWRMAGFGAALIVVAAILLLGWLP